MTMFAPVTTQSTVTLDGVQLLMRVIGGPQPVDSGGVEWVCTKLSGWAGRPKPRTARTAKPFGAGSFRSRAYQDSRIIGIEFVVTAPDAPTIRLVEQQLGAWCSDGGRLYELSVSDPPLDPQTALVELDDALLIAPRTWQSLQVSAQFVAPDPRKWSAAWMDRTSLLPTPSTDGVDYTDGVDFTNGMDYGVSGSPAVAQVANYGTAPVGPYISITGPVDQPRITDLISGWSLLFIGSLLAGDVLTINCDEFPQRGQPGHSALLNGATNVWSQVVRNGDWPQIDPQDIATYQITASALSTAVLVASVRSAWY